MALPSAPPRRQSVEELPMANAGLTTGVPVLDELIDGVRVGDNLVVLAPDAAVLDAIGRAFLDAVATAPRWSCAPRSAGARHRRTPRCSTGERARPARPETVPDRDERARGRRPVAAGEGASFLIDSLTGIQARWGERPRARGVPVDLPAPVPPGQRGDVAARTRPSTTAPSSTGCARSPRSSSTSGPRGDQLEAEVLTAAGRPGPTVGRRVPLDLATASCRRRTGGGRAPPARHPRPHAADHPRALAGRAGAPHRHQPVRPVAGRTRRPRVVGREPDPDLGGARRPVRPRGPRAPWLPHRPSRGPPGADLAEGVRGCQRLDDPEVGQIWELTVAPGASGRQPLFPGKSTEVVLVSAGPSTSRSAATPRRSTTATRSSRPRR
jgi:hypothetical protein